MAHQTNRSDPQDDRTGKGPFTSNQGAPISDDFNTLRAGSRGPALLEDFLFREKIFHFDHERIPERVVHARGAGAHGTFRLHTPIPELTRAGLFTDTQRETEVFVRFSTVVGSRGSTDLPRDVRGFAIKFYTQEGIFDLVGNNIPVFFIQDAINFPDLVHSLKPEERSEIPQAASAHNTFWDFASLMPETAHMVMWLMSDRAIPRSYRMMQGFGVNTLKLVNQNGEGTLVKFHLKPTLGVHSVVWDEAQKISGKNPDFHREDLWDNIEKGNFPSWELGVQVITAEAEEQLDFDVLDATKVIPEELVPIRFIGTMELNRNPTNFFSETEQVAFHPGHLVPGIDVSDDPLLQGRLFSYLDTQLSRLGSPNFHELPINRPKSPTRNFRREGAMRHDIPDDSGNYNPHSDPKTACPFLSSILNGGQGFRSHHQEVTGEKLRKRSATFSDHFTQAAIFYRSQTAIGQKHIQDAFSFELGKVTREEVRTRYLGILSVIDTSLASTVATRIGLPVPEGLSEETVMTARQIFEEYPVLPEHDQPTYPSLTVEYHAPSDSIATRRIAALAAEGFDMEEYLGMQQALTSLGAELLLLGPHFGQLRASNGEGLNVDHTFLTMDSALFDSVYLVGGPQSQQKVTTDLQAKAYLEDAYKHNKFIAIGSGPVQQSSNLLGNPSMPVDEGIVPLVSPDGFELFAKALSMHRYWSRELAATQKI